MTLLPSKKSRIKAAIAVVAGYFAAKALAATLGMVVLANGAGFLVGLFVGWKTSLITWSDISELAQKTSYFYNQSVMALSSPAELEFLSAQKLKAHHFVNCTAEAAGSAILGSLQRTIDKHVSDFIYTSSPLNIR